MNDRPGEIPFHCGVCGMRSYFGPVAAVGALVTNDADELLLVRRARQPGKGRWGLPGGFVDRDETVEEALAREVYEETRLTINHSRLLMSHPNQYHHHGVIVPVIDLFFECEIESSEGLRLADEELDDHQWGVPTTLELDRMAFHSNRLAVERWLSGRARAG